MPTDVFQRTALSFFLLPFLTGPVLADSVDDWGRMRAIRPRGYVCCRAEHPVKVDGRPDDVAWRDAAWTDDFVDIEGDNKPPPRFRTRAKMLWDDEYFYIAARLQEPHVWGTLTEHDAVIFQDNDFEVFIDPNGDNHEYYEFEMNALNTGWDLFLPRPYKDGGKADNGWEIPGLKTAVHVEGTLNDPSDRDTSWSLEIAVPWNVLREHAHQAAPPEDGDQWRVNFSRVQWRHGIENGKYRKAAGTREDNWVWSPQGIIDMHRPERWGFVQFSNAKPGTAEFEFASDWDARELLMTVYHHQKDFHQKHQRWAATLNELGQTELSPRLTLERTAAGFQAEVQVEQEGNVVPLRVRQDSKIWLAAASSEVEQQIEVVLTKQATAWNQGDIDEFMEHYWKSDELTFSSGGKTTRGWQATKENYRRRYPNREQMGRLTFAEVQVSALGEAAAFVLGRWRLQRDAGSVGGNFSLVFRRIKGHWLIVHDHTSREDPASDEE